MCGIVAAVADRNIVPVLLEGLNKLEYRGYDSAGLAVMNPRLTRLRSVGRAGLGTSRQGPRHEVHAGHLQRAGIGHRARMRTAFSDPHRTGNRRRLDHPVDQTAVTMLKAAIAAAVMITAVGMVFQKPLHALGCC